MDQALQKKKLLGDLVDAGCTR